MSTRARSDRSRPAVRVRGAGIERPPGASAEPVVEPSGSPEPQPIQPPAAVRGAALVLALEGLALIVLGAALIAESLVGAPSSVVFSLINAVLAIALGAVLILFGRSFLHLRRWARTPAALIQALALPVAWSLAQSQHWPIAAAVAVPALVVLYLLVTPAARLVFHRDGYAGSPAPRS